VYDATRAVLRRVDAPDLLDARLVGLRIAPLQLEALDELFRERPEISDGFMNLPTAPGLGLELREDTLEKYGVRIG
jgi:L-alanine-DL-glutamate epimerase-like enolase superfamily enzyme